MTNILGKVCTKCNEEKSLDLFAKRAAKKDGLNAWCKECMSIASKAALKRRNPKEIRERERKYWQENKDKKKAKDQRYYSKHYTKIRENQQEYYIANKDKLNQLNVEWARQNSEKRKAIAATWRKRHPDKIRENDAKRRASEKEAIGTFSNEEWQLMLSLYQCTCHYCQFYYDTLTKDHKIPLSRGGSHDWSNIVPACQPCNSQKGAKTSEEYFDWLEQKNIVYTETRKVRGVRND